MVPPAASPPSTRPPETGPAGRRGPGPWIVAAVVAAVLVIVGVGVVGVGALGGGSEPTAKVTPTTFPASWDPRVAPIAEWVADERDLEFAHPVEVVFQPEEEYLEDAAGDPTSASEEEQQEMDDFVATLRALGLVEGEVDLASAFSDISSEGTLAYYDPEREMVFVRGDELTPAVRVTVAHELTHVLQDQHFDLERLGDPDFDAAAGLRAVAEGDAGRIEDAYADEVLTPEEQRAYEEESDAAISGGEEALAGVPPVLTILFSAPYTLGEGFLQYREQVDGGQPWDAVLEDPPTPEELLDPAIWETGAAEVADVEVEAPDGVEVLDEDTFDPLTWYLLLASRGDPVDALRAVDGWGGDAYVAYREDDAVCAAMAVTGDDAEATQVLHDAVRGWADAVPGGGATVEVVDDVVRVQACDPGADAGGAGAVTEDLLVLPAFRAGLEPGLLSSGATPAQARCSSLAILERVSVAQLSADVLDPALEQEITDAVLGCR